MLYPRLMSAALLVIGIAGVNLFKFDLGMLDHGEFVSTAISLGLFLMALAASVSGFFGVMTSFGVEPTPGGFRMKENWFGRLIAARSKWVGEECPGFCTVSFAFGLQVILATATTFFVLGLIILALHQHEQALRLLAGIIATVAALGGLGAVAFFAGKLGRDNHQRAATLFTIFAIAYVGVIVVVCYHFRPDDALDFSGLLPAFGFVLLVLSVVAVPLAAYHYLKRLAIYRRVCPIYVK